MKKIALVTGCSSGIGLATSLDLARNNYKVYATIRDLARKDRLDKSIRDEQLDVEILRLDVTDYESIKLAVDQIVQKEGRIDVLVNNAGYGLVGAIDDLKIEDIKQQFETDFFGSAKTTLEIMPVMKRQNFGRIINVSSLAGRVGFGFMSAYVASKFALEGFTDAIRQELLGSDISMSTIEPGAVNTNFSQNMKLPDNPEISDERRALLQSIVDQTARILSSSFDPSVVSQKIIQILDEKEPKPRYIIGRDAERIMIDKNRMSDLEFEKTIAQVFAEMLDMNNNA